MSVQELDADRCFCKKRKVKNRKKKKEEGKGMFGLVYIYAKM